MSAGRKRGDPGSSHRDAHTGPPEDSHDGSQAPNEATPPERFADLLGDAVPIDRGRARLPPARPKPLRAARDRVTKAAQETQGVQGTPGFRWPDPENRHYAGLEGTSNAQLAALARGEPEPAERIDLHGARRDAAKRLLAKRIESARAQGLACVLVIHGRGQRSPTDEAVLRDALPDWLTRGAIAKHVLAFAPAPDRLGGLGATLVRLRRT